MALSEHEQQVLAQMERALSSEDPEFVSNLSGASRKLSAPANLGVSILVIVGGIAMLLGSVIVNQPALGVLGFFLTIGAIAAILHSVQQRGKQRPAKSKESHKAFMQGLEDRWDRRQDNR
jgi:hypothetical protein